MVWRQGEEEKEDEDEEEEATQPAFRRRGECLSRRNERIASNAWLR